MTTQLDIPAGVRPSNKVFAYLAGISIAEPRDRRPPEKQVRKFTLAGFRRTGKMISDAVERSMQ